MSRVAYTQRWPVKELACFMLSEIYTQFKFITDVLPLCEWNRFQVHGKGEWNETLSMILNDLLEVYFKQIC